MILGDKNEVQFQNTGDITYVAKFQKIDTTLNKLIDEIVAAQTYNSIDYGTLSEMINAYFDDILANRIIAGSGLSKSYNSQTKILTISLA